MWVIRSWRFWALFYFGQLLFFAVVYMFLANQFYHSTAKYEPTVRSDEREISREIASSFEANYSDIGFDKIFVNAEPLTVFLSSAESRYGQKIQIRAHMPFGDSFALVGETFYTSSCSDPFCLGFDFLEYEYFVEGFPERDLELDAIVLGFSQDFGTKFDGWAAAQNGSTARLNGLFWRMFYLSSVTTTTLGYGDIVPLTTPARVLVSIQTILSIIAMGGFISCFRWTERKD